MKFVAAAVVTLVAGVSIVGSLVGGSSTDPSASQAVDRHGPSERLVQLVKLRERARFSKEPQVEAIARIRCAAVRSSKRLVPETFEHYVATLEYVMTNEGIEIPYEPLEMKRAHDNAEFDRNMEVFTTEVRNCWTKFRRGPSSFVSKWSLSS